MNNSGFPLKPEADDFYRMLLIRMLHVMYPHDRIGNAPYERTASSVFKAADATPAQKIALAKALHDLRSLGFSELSDVTALECLKSIEKTQFFQFVRGIAVVTLYDDQEVWEVLGYEGPSFDKGGYLNRGFNDLDWLPEPRIEEYGEAK